MPDRDDEKSDKRFADTLRSRGALRECAACGEGTWVLMPDPEVPGVLGPKFSYVIPASSGAGVVIRSQRQGDIPVRVLICQNCGHVRMHSSALLENLARGDNRPLGDADDEL